MSSGNSGALSVTAVTPNSSFNPNPLRSTNNMAGKACHVVGSTTQVGLTQALGVMDNQPQPEDKYSKAIEPVAVRMDQAKWDVTRSVTLSGAGLSTAIVFLVTQIGVAACSL